MDNYIVCLVLSYLKAQDRDYDFNDLANLLGFTQLQLDKLIVYLQKNEFVEYINYELKITDKALKYLIAKNQLNSSLEDAEYGFTNIDTKSAMPFDVPYVPKKFSKKI